MLRKSRGLNMQTITIVCVGQPNVGKSSLVNKICGVHLKVGNFTGVTVEKSEACITYKGYELRIIDLPGTYSLNDYSFEERVTKQFLENEHYDIILNVLDSTNLERCLVLSAQLLELNSKMCIALNMSDEARKEGISINERILGEILGVKCVSVSAYLGENLMGLLDTLIEVATQKKDTHSISRRVYADYIEEEISNLTEFLEQKHYEEITQILKQARHGLQSLRDIALRLLMQDNLVTKTLHDKGCFLELSEYVQQCIQRLYRQSGEHNVRDIFNNDTLSFARGASMESMQVDKVNMRSMTQKIDSILLNKYLGIPIFFILMWLLFQITFYLGEYPKEWIEDGMATLGNFIGDLVPYEFVSSLISGGIFAGVGAVLSFLPHILILFCGIVLLEGSGYMARVAFLLDGFFHRFGLHGKSFIPLVTGFGCSVPAFMSARMLKNRNDRMLTLFIINFMSCGARLPVYTLFIGAFFSPQVAGNVLYGIYIFGAFVGLCMAKILKMTAFSGDDEPFVMEMPKYRMPSLRLICFSVWRKATSYLKKAGTFILLASIIIWAGTQFPKNAALDAEFEKAKNTIEMQIEEINAQKVVLDMCTKQGENGANEACAQSQDRFATLERELNSLELKYADLEHTHQAQLVEQSYLGRWGEVIQPLFAPLDFDWKFSISLVNGLLAKETIISSMGVLYALGDEIDEKNNTPLRSVLQEQVSMPSAIAFILFIMFYNPCFAASIVFSKEAGGKRYLLYLFIFTSVVSYIFALGGYWLTRAFLG